METKLNDELELIETEIADDDDDRIPVFALRIPLNLKLEMKATTKISSRTITKKIIHACEISLRDPVRAVAESVPGLPKLHGEIVENSAVAAAL